MAYYDKTKEHAFKTFNNDLKNGTLPNVMLFYGEEEYLVKWANDSVSSKFVSDAAMSMDYVKLADDPSVDDIISSCETFSMFMGNRVVTVADFPVLKNEKAKGYGMEAVSALTEYIKNINSSTYLLFTATEVNEKGELFNAIKEYGKVYDFSRLDEKTLSGFITKQFKTHGLAPDRDIIRYYINQTGYFNKESEYRLFNVINDITKIAALSEGMVTRESIDSILIGDMDTFIFNFTDAISNNRKDQAFQMLHSILREKDVFNITNVLIGHFELLLEVLEFKKKGMTVSEIQNKLKIHEFRLKKALQTCERFNVRALKDVLIKLYEVDRNIKNGILDGEMALELILAGI